MLYRKKENMASYDRLKLYYVEDKYIDYLRQYDKIVPYNKSTTRPYIGIVYTYNNFNYFAPLSSPKPKHLKLNKKAVDIWKILDGKLGLVNFNNMIPCPIETLKEVLPMVTDEKYKNLLEDQISSLNADRERLLNKINTFQIRYRSGKLDFRIKERCCDFELLEEKCKEYSKNMISGR